MSDKKDYLTSVAKKRAPLIEKRRVAAETTARQAVNMADLTGNPDWDLFLSFISAASEQASMAMNYYSNILLDPSIVDNQIMMQAKVSHALSQERVAVLKEISELPNDIIKAGEGARGLLERLGSIETEKADAPV